MTPEFQQLSEDIKIAELVVIAAYATLNEKYPLEKYHRWGMSAANRLRPWYIPPAEGDDSEYADSDCDSDYADK